MGGGQRPLGAGRRPKRKFIMGNGTMPFPDSDFLFRRYQPSAHPLCGAGALKMSLLYQLDAKSFWMRVGGILWGRRPPSAGGGPVLKRRLALRAGRRQNLSPFRRFLIANGITSPHSLHPLPPFQGGRGSGWRGIVHPCAVSLRGPPVTLYHFESKAFLMCGGGGHARLRGERQLHITLPSYIQKPFARNWY